MPCRCFRENSPPTDFNRPSKLIICFSLPLSPCLSFPLSCQCCLYLLLCEIYIHFCLLSSLLLFSPYLYVLLSLSLTWHISASFFYFLSASILYMLFLSSTLLACILIIKSLINIFQLIFICCRRHFFVHFAANLHT